MFETLEEKAVEQKEENNPQMPEAVAEDNNLLEELFKAVVRGDRLEVLKATGTTSDLFLKSSPQVVPGLFGRTFAAGTTPLQVLFWSSEPMLDEVLTKLNEQKSLQLPIRQHRLDYLFTGLQTASYQGEMQFEKFFSFDKIFHALKNKDIKAYHEALRDLPGWVPQLICLYDIADGCDLKYFNAYRRTDEPKFLDDRGTAWSELFDENSPYCGMYWYLDREGPVTLLPLKKGENHPANFQEDGFQSIRAAHNRQYKKFAADSLDLQLRPTSPQVGSFQVTIPNEYFCRISGKLMKKPVAYRDVAPPYRDWYMYETEVLNQYFRNHPESRVNHVLLLPSTMTEEDIRNFKVLNAERFYDPLTMKEREIEIKSTPFNGCSSSASSGSLESKTAAEPAVLKKAITKATESKTEKGVGQLLAYKGHFSTATTSASTVPASAKAAPPQKFLCGLTGQLMNDPVEYLDGVIYERFAITEWLLKQNQSPTGPTGKTINMDRLLVPQVQLKEEIEEQQYSNQTVLHCGQ